MDESTIRNDSNVEEQPDSAKKYCFGCLCVNEEKHIQNYAFKCGPLKNLFQVTCLHVFSQVN